MFEDTKGVMRNRQYMDRQYRLPPRKTKGQKPSQKNKIVSNMITAKIGSSGRLGLDSKGNRCYTHDNNLDVINYNPLHQYSYCWSTKIPKHRMTC